MQIMVTFPDGHVFPAHVSDDMELENFFALCQAESTLLQNLDIGRLTMFFEGRFYNDKKQTLKTIGVKNGDMVMVQVQRPNAVSSIQGGGGGGGISDMDFSSIRLPNSRGAGAQSLNANPNSDPEALARAVLADPNLLAALKQNNPTLAEALESGDIGRFTQMVGDIRRVQLEELERRRRILANPLDPEAQRLLEEDIRRRHIEENMEIAMEHTPESFGYVHMLYIRCKVNGHEIKAFVDSGAQSTIMSESCARVCNVTRLIDHRFQGIAKGVGTSKIIGRIHLAQLQIGNDYLPTSFMVLEDQSVDMLLGLDMLKRHQCVIDLKHNKLIIGTTGGATEFLHENELPAYARQQSTATEEDMGLKEAIANSLNDPKNRASGSSAEVGGPSRPVVPSSVPTAAAAAAAVEDSAVTKLVAMGFPRDGAIEALRKSGGNVDAAAALLIAQSLPAPKVTKK